MRLQGQNELSRLRANGVADEETVMYAGELRAWALTLELSGHINREAIDWSA